MYSLFYFFEGSWHKYSMTFHNFMQAGYKASNFASIGVPSYVMDDETGEVLVSYGL